MPVWDTLSTVGWRVSSQGFAGARGDGRDGLMIAVRETCSVELVTHPGVSGSFGGAQRSSILACTAKLRWMVQGMVDIGVVTMHIHRLAAKRGLISVQFQGLVQSLERALTECSCRVLTGDANMALFLVATALRERNWDIRLASHHREVALTSSVDLLSTNGRRHGLRYDSMGAPTQPNTGALADLEKLSTCVH